MNIRTVLMFLTMLTPMMMDAQSDLGYQMPHDDIRVLADAAMAPSIRINADATTAVLLYRNKYKSINELSEKEMRLAGLRINPVTNISSRANYFYDMKVLDIQSGKESIISGLPAEARISNITWSPDQNFIAYTHTNSNGVELWVLDVEKRSTRKLTEARVNANMREAINWLHDESAILVTMLPVDRQPLVNTNDAVPTGPTISVNDGGKKAQNRTYQDLLKNPTDESNFKSLANSEIWKVDLKGKSELWMKADMYTDIEFSPDGRYAMVQTIHEPFSYLVPYSRFPSTTTIYNMNANKVKTMLEVPLIEDLPQGFMAVRTGMRSLRWRSDKAATLYWAEALDGGDPEIEVEYRDAVYQQAAPFTAEKELLLKTKFRYSGIIWGSDELAISYDYWWNTRMIRTVIFNPSDAQTEQVLFDERNYQDQYSDPGDFVTKRNQYDRATLDINGDQLYLLGEGFSEKGKFPYVDTYNYKTQKKDRIFQTTAEDQLESFVVGVDMAQGKVLTRIESKNEYPNYFFRDINTGKLSAVTNFENPFKAIQNVHKEVITYKRDDGVELSATLYLPVGYDMVKKEKMPMIMWAYPREYKDKASAGQVTSSSNEFTYPWYGSPIFWVNRGYVVLDDAAFPIIGEGDDQPNDSFRKQLVGNAKAAIDAVDAMGYIDRNRVAVGGHSYGAFMTANLLSHSDLFAAGIARSGAYNRTLTPFGFQSEERNYWESPEVYYKMSPFSHADKMKTPLLLVHGEADNNSGTYPMQSERYFNALKGLGATVRLVMLPKESHGYAAKESIMHMLWEQDQWLEKYVKNREVKP